MNTMSKQLFGKKRNNNGMVWASIIGLVVSAAAYFLRKNPGTNGPNNKTIQNVMGSLTSAKNINPIPSAVMAEFAKELLPDNTQNQTK